MTSGTSVERSQSTSELASELKKSQSLPANNILTPNRKPLQVRKINSTPNTPKTVSPSIKSFFTKKTNSENTTPASASKTYSKSCKRKLSDESASCDSPKKRQNVLEGLPSSPLSPHKAGSPTVTAFQNHPSLIMESPRKCFTSPLASPLKNIVKQSPAKKLSIKNSPLKKVNSPRYGELADSGASAFPSPTVNLPNLVFSGGLSKVNVYAEEKENSPKKTPGMDWLTKMRKQTTPKDNKKPKSRISPKRTLFERSIQQKNPHAQTEEVASSQESQDSDSSQAAEVAKVCTQKYVYFVLFSCRIENLKKNRLIICMTQCNYNMSTNILNIICFVLNCE